MTDDLRELRDRILKTLAGDDLEHPEDIAWVLAPVMRDYAAERLRAVAAKATPVRGERWVPSADLLDAADALGTGQ